jgi:chaperonin cofactor prefoldin
MMFSDESMGKLLQVVAGATITATMGLVGWAFTQEGRMQVVATQVADRGPRIEALEREVNTLVKETRDPTSKPETRVALEGLKQEISQMREQMDRVEERINSIQSYLLYLPRPAGAPTLPFKKGELDAGSEFKAN